MLIPYGRQEIDAADVAAVVEALQSDFLTQGPVVPRFEQAVADLAGCRHALAFNSATSALHVACLALGLGPGDVLWTSPVTFVASANCGLYCGAAVDFVDIDPLTGNLCPQALEDRLTQAAGRGALPKIVVAVHLAGRPCEMQRIHAACQRFGVRIIEDASHAIGARYLDRPVGACDFSDITVFSFHPVKIVTTAEGGLALTRDSQLAANMALLRSHGITRDPDQMTCPPDGPWYYQQIALGFNYRMSELHGALGLSQLRRLQEFVARRESLATRYDSLLAGLPVRCPTRSPELASAWHLYVIRLQSAAIRSSHLAVFERLRAAGIGVNLHYIPVHLHPYYQALGFRAGDFPQAEQYYAEAISLPLYTTLTLAQQDRVVATLTEALET